MHKFANQPLLIISGLLQQFLKTIKGLSRTLLKEFKVNSRPLIHNQSTYHNISASHNICKWQSTIKHDCRQLRIRFHWTPDWLKLNCKLSRPSSYFQKRFKDSISVLKIKPISGQPWIQCWHWNHDY